MRCLITCEDCASLDFFFVPLPLASIGQAKLQENGYGFCRWDTDRLREQDGAVVGTIGDCFKLEKQVHFSGKLWKNRIHISGTKFSKRFGIYRWKGKNWGADKLVDDPWISLLRFRPYAVKDLRNISRIFQNLGSNYALRLPICLIEYLR